MEARRARDRRERAVAVAVVELRLHALVRLPVVLVPKAHEEIDFAVAIHVGHGRGGRRPEIGRRGVRVARRSQGEMARAIVQQDLAAIPGVGRGVRRVDVGPAEDVEVTVVVDVADRRHARRAELGRRRAATAHLEEAAVDGRVDEGAAAAPVGAVHQHPRRALFRRVGGVVAEVWAVVRQDEVRVAVAVEVGRDDAVAGDAREAPRGGLVDERRAGRAVRVAGRAGVGAAVRVSPSPAVACREKTETTEHAHEEPRLHERALLATDFRACQPPREGKLLPRGSPGRTRPRRSMSALASAGASATVSSSKNGRRVR